MFILTSLKTEIERSVRGPKLQEPRAEDVLAESYFVQENVGVLLTADHKVLSYNCESRNQSSICSRGAGLGHPMDPVVSVQNKNFAGNTKEVAKFLGAR